MRVAHMLRRAAAPRGRAGRRRCGAHCWIAESCRRSGRARENAAEVAGAACNIGFQTPSYGVLAQVGQVRTPGPERTVDRSVTVRGHRSSESVGRS
eukprot:280543-Prymnesium_polylepis.1